VSGYGERLAAWAARAGAQAASVRYPRPAAGGTTAALRLAPAGGARARAVVVHGAGNDAVYLLLELFRALLARGVEVFAFDVDGHGTGSDTVFDVATVRGAVASAVEAAGADGDELPLHLVGHSLGGSLVLDALASGALPAVASAVALSAPLEVHLGPRTVVSELAGFFRPATLSQREHYGLWGLVPAFGPVRRASFPFRRTDAGGGAFGYVRTVRRLLDEMRLPERAAAVGAPTLLVYSRGDHLAGHHDGERLAAAIPGARLLCLERPTHYGVAFDREAVGRTAEWVATHPGAPE
jgi:alpha-beta hydrolase superfamily lysophospholipase